MNPSEGYKGNILIIDDTPDNLDMLTRMLTKRGFRVRPAITGELALNAVRVMLPDLILLDIMMPDIDGYEICQRLKADEQTRDIPVLFISALHEGINKIKAFNVGGVDYIVKPFYTEEVLARVETHLALRTMQKQLQTRNAQLQQEIVERKRAEEERRHLEARLRQRQRLEALGTLAGGIAHDFNNILASILGYIEILLNESYENIHVKQYLEYVYHAGERAADLVEQILAFSRSQEQHLTPITITPILKDSLKMLRATIPAHISIYQNVPSQCRPILADATQIHQVITNVCINAGQAMMKRGGTLKVSLEEVNHNGTYTSLAHLKHGPYLKLTVSDTGHGMTPDVQERIFEPFFSFGKEGKGTGLGLSVVYGIVKAHHGEIIVESEPDKGSAVTIFFPIVEKQVPQDAPSHTEPVEKGKGSILVVEDESNLTTLYELALTKLGYEVTVCYDGKEALDIFRADPTRFDLVYTDQAMPHMTGEQLSRELLRMNADLPIILATGYSETLTPEKAYTLGIRQYLKKPVKIRHLVQHIQRLLNSSTENPSIQ